MHVPITVKEMIRMLNNIKNKDKVILIENSYNVYDVLGLAEDSGSVTLATKHSSKRDEVDGDDDMFI